MANPTPLCTVNAATPPVDVTAGSTATIALVSAAGANYWDIRAVGTDDLSTTAAINASIAINQTNKTATFSAPSLLGTAVIFQSTVGVLTSSTPGHGKDANGVIQPSFTTTFKVNVRTSGALAVMATNETIEQSSTFGWITLLNAIIRAGGGGGGGTPVGLGTAGQFLVTNSAASATAWATVTGDASASTSTVGKLTVTGFQGRPFASTAPTDGQAIVWSAGGATWQPSTISSAGSVTWAGDLPSSTNSSQWVSSLSGTGGSGTTITINAGTLQWAAGVTPILQSATLGSDAAPNNFSITAQSAEAAAATNRVGANIVLTGGNGATTNGTPGSILAALGTPTGTGTEAFFTVQRAGTPIGSFGYGTTAQPSMFLGSLANAANYTVSADTANNNVFVNGANSVNISVGGNNTLISCVSSAVTVNPSTLQFGAGATPVFRQVQLLTDSPTHTFSIIAQNADPSAVTNTTGATLSLQGGSGASSNGTPGGVTLTIQGPSAGGSEALIQMLRVSAPLFSYGVQASIRPTSWAGTAGGNNYWFTSQADGSLVNINSATNLFLCVNANSILTLSSSSIAVNQPVSGNISISAFQWAASPLITLTNAGLTLSASQYCYHIMRFTGTVTSTAAIVVPAVRADWIIDCSSMTSGVCPGLDFNSAGGGSGFSTGAINSVVQAYFYIYSDGTNVTGLGPFRV